ncbi:MULTISPECIES: HesB/IscA family protein [Legionella]|uniref:Iron-sulfur cluster assembly accessory protein n=1 Tax=Legionella septentrionalis TaxID=2498109 RepID=A0A3S0VAY8_9GAMM|nr:MULTISPECIES: iron-sulfur cluster assembly accessory protein [Legionella]MCP0914312.1 iron-sulfur cluster assembly accessory protein [Legionella sp. 27cVA30]RUQ89027.1 iron-sulfur cluster assembly accessory protein [Legionella septentrionalis]RUR00334.1 iron-sulfur cluster assembly accessory protein [Legionella septentrionalis]RUR11809.1 iron-sulfur cluster assembly accessory protein [Legionella septentrionalis]
MSVMQVSKSETQVKLTDAACKHVLAYLQKQGSHGIRLSVKKTGCSGLSYVVDYVEKAAAGDVIMPLNEHYILCIEKTSYPYLKGMEIDYVKQGLNYKFVFNNPNQTGQCGCGESFTVD